MITIMKNKMNTIYHRIKRLESTTSNFIKHSGIVLIIILYAMGHPFIIINLISVNALKGILSEYNFMKKFISLRNKSTWRTE
jgi:hypothetical protein